MIELKMKQMVFDKNLVMVSIWWALLANCSSDVPSLPEPATDPTDPPPVIYPNSDDSEFAPLVTFIDGLPPPTTTGNETFNITIKGNKTTTSYQWALVDGDNCNNASYNQATTFPDDKNHTFTINDQGEDGNKTLCAIGLGKNATSQPTTHSWQKQSPPPPEEEEETDNNDDSNNQMPITSPTKMPVATPVERPVTSPTQMPVEKPVTPPSTQKPITPPTQTPVRKPVTPPSRSP